MRVRGWGLGAEMRGLAGLGSYMGYGKGIAGAFDSLAGPGGGKGERWRIVAISKGPWLCAERTTKGDARDCWFVFVIELSKTAE